MISDDASFRLLAAGIERSDDLDDLCDLSIMLQKLADQNPIKVSKLLATNTIEKLHDTLERVEGDEENFMLFSNIKSILSNCR